MSSTVIRHVLRTRRAVMPPARQSVTGRALRNCRAMAHVPSVLPSAGSVSCGRRHTHLDSGRSLPAFAASFGGCLAVHLADRRRPQGDVADAPPCGEPENRCREECGHARAATTVCRHYRLTARLSDHRAGARRVAHSRVRPLGPRTASARGLPGSVSAGGNGPRPRRPLIPTSSCFGSFLTTSPTPSRTCGATANPGCS